MKLIEFNDDSENGKVYVNPEWVRTVFVDEFHEGRSIISLIGSCVLVKGTPEEVANKLVRGYSV